MKTAKQVLLEIFGVKKEKELSAFFRLPDDYLTALDAMEAYAKEAGAKAQEQVNVDKLLNRINWMESQIYDDMTKYSSISDNGLILMGKRKAIAEIKQWLTQNSEKR